MTEFLRFCAGLLALTFIVAITPSPVRRFIGALLVVCTVLALIGLATGSKPH